MATVDELLSKLVNLEIEAVHARQRQAAAEQALTAAQQQIQQLSSGGGLSRSSSENESHQHAHAGEAEVVDRTTLGVNDMAVYPQGVRMRRAPQDVFDLATQKGSGPITSYRHVRRVANVEHSVALRVGDDAERSSRWRSCGTHWRVFEQRFGSSCCWSRNWGSVSNTEQCCSRC